MKNLQELSDSETTTEITRAVEVITGTEEGVLFFQYLHAVCGMSDTSLRLDATGVVDKDASINQEGRRALYLNLRPFINRNRLISIELPDLKPKEQTPIHRAKPKRGMTNE